MQEVSKFFGLVVRMEYEEDAVPFVHVNYEASKGISYYAKVSVSRHRGMVVRNMLGTHRGVDQPAPQRTARGMGHAPRRTPRATYKGTPRYALRGNRPRLRDLCP